MGRRQQLVKGRALQTIADNKMPSYLPASDSDFDAWQKNFLAYATGHRPQLGLTLGDLIVPNSLAAVWDAQYAAHVAAQAAARAATQNKDAARAGLETQIRALAQRLQASPDVEDAERAALRLTVLDRSPTPVPVPATRPVVQIDTRQRLQHTLHFADETTPTSRRKPRGASAVEIWTKTGGPPPKDVSELAFLATDTRSPYLAVYELDHGGQPAHYMLRWINTKGQPGPWSQTATATIGA
ncbi:MAG: hypothetical protein IT449_07715 [Phycisphaerales bacterium]|nr:hypothetical protein [Phycisphaerales bacterium]